MATRSWLSTAATGDWKTAANWSPATVPVSNDDVIIDAGSVNIDDGLGNSTIDLDSLFIGPNYTGQVGNSDTAPLILNGCDSMVIAGGGSNHYIDGGGGGDIDVCVVEKVGASGNGNISLMGAITKLVIKQGVVKLYSDTTAEVVLNAAAGTIGNATLNVLNATLTLLHLIAGAVVLDEDSTAGEITTARMGAGSLTIEAGQLVNLYQYGGSSLWETSETLTLAKLYRGATFQTSPSAAARTITTLERHAGSIFILDDAAGKVTITTESDFGGKKYANPSEV